LDEGETGGFVSPKQALLMMLACCKLQGAVRPVGWAEKPLRSARPISFTQHAESWRWWHGSEGHQWWMNGRSSGVLVVVVVLVMVMVETVEVVEEGRMSEPATTAASDTNQAKQRSPLHHGRPRPRPRPPIIN